ncbi:MAG: hypothetical protein LC792_11710 [Actinobacteria bacterium]|nr:hypothetical protein [Actinomycetota bacterium]
MGDYYNQRVFGVLSRRGEYERCRRWMADPTADFDQAAEILEFQRSSTGPEIIRERAPERFIDRTIELAVVLLGADDPTGADEIVQRARRHIDHPRLTTALDEARTILQKRPPVRD